MVGESGTIWATTDGGFTWASQASPTKETLNGVAFAADGLRGWAVGEFDTILRTADGGATWARNVYPNKDIFSENFTDVSFTADGLRGWVIGEGSTILTTTDGGVTWISQASPTNQSLNAVAIAADGLRGWAVGDTGTIALGVNSPFTITDIELGTIGNEEEHSISFVSQSDLDDPIWSVEITARTVRRDWVEMGYAELEARNSRDAKWRLKWNPAEKDFRPGDEIQYRATLNIRTEVATVDLGSVVYEHWLTRVWKEYRTALIATAVPFGLYLTYVFFFLGVFAFAPARLATVGVSPIGAISSLEGNIAFFWGVSKELRDTIGLMWLCRSPRVRRSWILRYAAGKSSLEDLGEYSRKSFLDKPDVLDAWVQARAERIQTALDAMDLYKSRKVFVPLPVRMGETRIVERPDAETFRNTFERSRAVAIIVARGGAGKSTLACAISRWALSHDPEKKLMPHRAVPVFVSQDTTNLLDTVTRTLRQMLGEEELPLDLIRGLLIHKRVMVIVDALSEREPATQHHIAQIFQESSLFNAVVITSRTEPKLGAVERTTIRPTPLDQKHIVPFIVDYVARGSSEEGSQHADAKQSTLQVGRKALQEGDTLLELGKRILAIVRTGNRSTPLTPLLVSLFVNSAAVRAATDPSLNGLPQDVPEIFVDALRRVYVDPSADAPDVAADDFVRAARVLAQMSLGVRLVPSDFSLDDAKSALASAGLSTGYLDAHMTSGVVERRSLAGTTTYRFALDPVAEYLAAIQSVSELRGQPTALLAAKFSELAKIDGYPSSCEGYLRAFATCYRAYEQEFSLPNAVFPWELEQSPGSTPYRHS